MASEFEVFPGKDLSGLFKDIYDNQKQKKDRISELIFEIRKVIRHAGDYAVLGPIIIDLVSTSVRNDETLIKLAQIAQKLASAEAKTDGEVGFLSESEKAQLIRDFEEATAAASSVDINSIENNILEIKEKLASNE